MIKTRKKIASHKVMMIIISHPSLLQKMVVLKMKINSKKRKLLRLLKKLVMKKTQLRNKSN